MRRLVAFAIALVVAGCATTQPATIAPTSTPIVHAEDAQGPFRVVFEVPKGTWTSGDTIDGVATLALIEGGSVDIGGSSGGLFGFDFAEVGGSRHIEPVWTADCTSYRLEAGKPVTSKIRKSGEFTAEQPDDGFNRSFLEDPVVHLPAGDWKITAIAPFIEGKTCGGLSHSMKATVLVHVSP